MNDTPESFEDDDMKHGDPAIPNAIPSAVVDKRRRSKFSLVWLLPLIAILIGGWLAIQAVIERGPSITISFKTAEGITTGTRIKYRNVDIGEVKKTSLSDDHGHVIVKAQMTQQARSMLVKDTRFWVVRPRISGGNVTGLGTVLAGAHIGMDTGKSSESERHFVGLERPSIVNSDVPGRLFTLRSEDVGSLDVGSPVYFRHIQAGQVAAFELSPDGKQVLITIFVNAPYDRYVKRNTRFWHANGIDINLDANGVKINTESLVSILLGGLAFENLDESEAQPQAPENTVFNTFANKTDALKVPDTNIEHGVLVFRESVRGLQPGAQIDFRGIVIGEVISNSIDYDPVKKEVNVAVDVNLYPDRLRSKFRKSNAANRIPSHELLGRLVERGLRAQLRTSNLLTGQLYIALDFFPNAAKVQFDPNSSPLELPTTTGSLRELQVTLASIANKLDKVPFDAIGSDIHQTMNSANKLLTQLDKDLAPQASATLGDVRTTLTEARATLTEARTAITEAQRSLKAIEGTVAADGPLQQNTNETLREVSRAAQSMRALADYLERHPEALIRGKKEDNK